MRRRRFWIALALIAVLALGYAVLDRSAAAKQRELESVLASLPVPPGANVVGTNASHKPGYASVRLELEVDASVDAVEPFYDQVLTANGWRRVSDGALLDWGRDFGGRAHCYGKADVSALLDYYGSQGVRASYTFVLVWGSSLCRE